VILFIRKSTHDEVTIKHCHHRPLKLRSKIVRLHRLTKIGSILYSSFDPAITIFTAIPMYRISKKFTKLLLALRVRERTSQIQSVPLPTTKHIQSTSFARDSDDTLLHLKATLACTSLRWLIGCHAMLLRSFLIPNTGHGLSHVVALPPDCKGSKHRFILELNKSRFKQK
jgi:hypothetical protein